MPAMFIRLDPVAAVRLAGTLLLLGAGWSAAAVVAMARTLLAPPRMSDGKALWIFRRLSPADLGLAFEDVSFVVRDDRSGKKLRLAGWWMPHPGAAGRCVVLLHGYADAKVGAIAWAPLWHSLGFNILAMDMRAHGQSDGVHCTAGDKERYDISQVLDQCKAERPEQTRQIILFGVSLGAAIAGAVAALREDMSAVVMDSPLADFRSAAMAQMDSAGAPGRWFQSAAVWLAERWAGANLSALRPVDLLGRITCPVLLIAPKDDPFLSPAERLAMQQAMEARNRPGQDLFWLVDAGHNAALQAQPEEYARRLKLFVERALSALASKER